MIKPLFTGVCTALVTPFSNDTIDYGILRKLLQFQIDSGIKAVVISGTTGEASTLSDQEKIELLRESKSFVDEQLLVIAGTGSNNTKHAISLSKSAEDNGADGLLVVSPYYNKATAAGLIKHYTAIAQSVHIPVIIYNVPSRTGVDIPVEVYKELAKIENIVGVKEASTDINKILKIRSVCGSNFPVWSGNDQMTVPAISLGCKGTISVMSNILPALAKEMTDAALSGDYSKAREIQMCTYPLCESLFSEVNPIPVKAAMKLIGYDCGNCRLPLSELSNDNYDLLKKQLKNLLDCK